MINKKKHCSKRYHCKKCKFYSSKLSLFKTHLQTTKHCKHSDIHIKDIKNFEDFRITVYSCNTCKKKYMSNRSLQEHMKECNNKANKIIAQNNLQKQVDTLNDVIDEIIIKQQKIDDNIDITIEKTIKKSIEKTIEKTTNKPTNKPTKDSTETPTNKLTKDTTENPTETPIEKPIKLKKQRIPHVLRSKVWDTWIGLEKGKSKCLCCDISEITQFNFHCGHIIAESKGGTTNVNNLKPICGSCNSSMGTENFDEFKNKYLEKK